MIRLLAALLIISLSIYLLVFRQSASPEKKPDVIYQDAVRKANKVELQVLEAADQQRENIEKAIY